MLREHRTIRPRPSFFLQSPYLGTVQHRSRGGKGFAWVGYLTKIVLSISLAPKDARLLRREYRWDRDNAEQELAPEHGTRRCWLEV